MLDIVEADAIDELAGKEDKPTKATKKTTKPATPAERQEAKKELINEDGEATDTQIKAIKNGLKKLKEKDLDKYETFIRASMKKIKAGLKKVEADDMLIEIGDKVEE
jgi:hypothetical protein